MKLTYDKEADAAYIYFKEIKKTVARTVSVNEHMNVDLGSKGEILGIEILGSSSQLLKSDLLKKPGLQFISA